MPPSLPFALEIGESFMSYLRSNLSAGGNEGFFCSKKGLRMPSGLQNLELESLTESLRSGEPDLEQDTPNRSPRSGEPARDVIIACSMPSHSLLTEHFGPYHS